MSYIHHKFGKTFFLKFKTKSKNPKTPLVFLHGGPGGAHGYFLPLMSLSKDRDIYMYDQIGGGDSSAIQEKHWKIETFVEELSILTKKWKLEKFILVSVSWGTTLALEYVLRTKDPRIEKIVFQSPLFSTKDWQADADYLITKLPIKTQKVINYCHEIEATDSKVYQKALNDYYLKHVLRVKPRKSKKPKKPNTHGNQVYAYMWGPSEFKATGTLKKYERASKLKSLKLPVLLICGEHDEATPRTVEKYHRQIRGSKFAVIKGASHCISREKPKALIKQIQNFIS